MCWREVTDRVRVESALRASEARYRSARESATLGLQLVHMLAKQLGGTVAVHSAGGTTVDVHLPK